MIFRPTVLILGAGASNHLDYPLGRSLISQLCEKLRRPASVDPALQHWKQAETDDFIKRLSRSGHYSIDAFLEENPNHLELGRFSIARILKAKENFDTLFPPGDSGWYQYLFNKLIGGDHRAERFGENRLTIITFNYDRSLECYLHEGLQHRFGLSVNEATERLNSLTIIHPHGVLGQYPAVPYTPEASFEELRDIARGIKIIHEFNWPTEGFCSPEFEQANQCLREAERIIFLGFGYHRDNIRRFNFFTPEALEGKEVDGSSQGIGTAQRKELVLGLAEFGITDTMMVSYGTDQFFTFHTTL